MTCFFPLQVNSQLLEAIQQKVELSQQLEQWQVDMEQLLEGQMRERLQYGDKRVHSSASALSVSSECSEGGNGNTQPRTASRIFSFFQRNCGKRVRAFFSDAVSNIFDASDFFNFFASKNFPFRIFIKNFNFFQKGRLMRPTYRAA